MNSKRTDLALLLLRITFGGLMLLNHGLPKLQKLMAGGEIQFPDPLGVGAEISLSLAIFAEVLCAFLLIIGAFTRLTVVPLIVTMLIAIFAVHASDPFSKMESAILFLIPYVCLLITGAGWYSVDSLRNR
ncbi:MAG: putative oxidoreductase [Paraglaciecola sp.]|jgi:putative oxidoreductase